jgi:hypothetical protein
MVNPTSYRIKRKCQNHIKKQSKLIRLPGVFYRLLLSVFMNGCRLGFTELADVRVLRLLDFRIEF